MRDAEICPFLVPVVADRLWMYPLGAYCRRPDGRVRVPAAATLAGVCTTASHAECVGYRSVGTRGERAPARARRGRESLTRSESTRRR